MQTTATDTTKVEPANHGAFLKWSGNQSSNSGHSPDNEPSALVYHNRSSPFMGQNFNTPMEVDPRGHNATNNYDPPPDQSPSNSRANFIVQDGHRYQLVPELNDEPTPPTTSLPTPIGSQSCKELSSPWKQQQARDHRPTTPREGASAPQTSIFAKPYWDVHQ